MKKFDFRTIERAICDVMRAEGLDPFEIAGDWFFEAWVDDEDDPGPEHVSITKIAERIAAELEDAK